MKTLLIFITGAKRASVARSSAPSGTLAIRQPGFINLRAKALAHSFFDRGMADYPETKAVRDSVYGHVIMGGSDTSRGEDPVKTLRETSDLLADQFDFVGNCRDLLNVHAELTQLGAKEVGIDVLGFPGQHLVTNDDDTGSF